MTEGKLFIPCLVCVLVCLIPSLDGPRIQSNHIVNDALSSISGKPYQFSLVFTLGIGVPLAIDFLFDIIFAPAVKTRSNIPTLALLISLLVPDFIILIYAIPFENAELTLGLVLSRVIVVNYSFAGHLWSLGGKFFQTNRFVLTICLIFVANVLYFWDWLTTNPGTSLFYSYSIFALLGYFMLIIEFFNWFRRIHNTPWKSLSPGELSCTAYITIYSLWGTVMVILTILFHGRISCEILTTYSYILAFYTVSISVLQSRLLKYEVDNTSKLLEIKKNFVRFISHEIRTPLNSAFMGLEILKSELNNPHYVAADMLETLEEVKAACDLSLEILNDLLSMEKLESGLLCLERDCVEALPWFLDTVRPFLVQARKLNISLLYPEANSPAANMLSRSILYIDKVRMAQVLRNLLSNALKFSPNGGTVTVTAEEIDNHQSLRTDGRTSISMSNRLQIPGKFLRIRVVDNGAGISQDNLPKLFKSVIQFNPGKLQNSGGSGFGLFLSKSIVDMHQGQISVHSEGEGRGCTFTLDIPMVISVSSRIPAEGKDGEKLNDGDIIVEKRNFLRTSITKLTRQLSFKKVNPAESLKPTSPFYMAEDAIILKSGVDGGEGRGTARIVVPDQPSSSRRKPGERDQLSRRRYSSKEIILLEKREKSQRSNRQISFRSRATPSPELGMTENLDLNILVVDDAQSNRRMLCRLLKRKYRIDEAEDGMTALHKVTSEMNQSGMFHVVLLDNQMPNMDGPTAAKAMRAAGYDGVIIGITGNALPPDISHFISSGADRVFPKPVNIQALEACIIELVMANQYSRQSVVNNSRGSRSSSVSSHSRNRSSIFRRNSMIQSLRSSLRMSISFRSVAGGGSERSYRDSVRVAVAADTHRRHEY